MTSDSSWIIFSYRVPSETSTLRVRSWRILRRIGALYLQQSVCAVPRRPEVVRKLTQLRELVEQGGGETLWLDVEQFTQEAQDQLVQRMNSQRAQEYTEFMEECDSMIRSDSSARTDGACQSHLQNLHKRLRKLRMRDYFSCPLAAEAATKLEQVECHVMSAAAPDGHQED